MLSQTIVKSRICEDESVSESQLDLIGQPPQHRHCAMRLMYLLSFAKPTVPCIIIPTLVNVMGNSLQNFVTNSHCGSFTPNACLQSSETARNARRIVVRQRRQPGSNSLFLRAICSRLIEVPGPGQTDSGTGSKRLNDVVLCPPLHTLILHALGCGRQPVSCNGVQPVAWMIPANAG